MAANDIINVNLFGLEIGRIGLDEDSRRSSFQYNPDFLNRTDLQNIFPETGIIKRVSHAQLFSQFDNDTFKGIPPQFADSLPDRFGSIIFKTWLEDKDEQQIHVLEQLAYVANRGMGALEYSPRKKIPKHSTINLNEIIQVLRKVLDLKSDNVQVKLDSRTLVNIFKIGTSAGGARPKIIISENKKNGKIIPGDLDYSGDYDHYLVKLAIDDDLGYPREVIEYCYYQVLQSIGIDMMDSKLIDNQHFATLRYDRQDGEKRHILTASGMTGWDFKSAEHSSYEQLFKLCSFLKLPHTQMEQLFKRMVFNVIYGNADDHLKNHSFVYDRMKDRWNLSPAYDITFSLNPLLNFKKTNRALSVNGKRDNITLEDLYKIANDFTIKNPKGIIKAIQTKKNYLLELLKEHDVSDKVIKGMVKSLKEYQL